MSEKELMDDWMQKLADASRSSFADAKSITGRQQPPRISILGGQFALVDANGQQRPVPGGRLRFVAMKVKTAKPRFWYPPPYDGKGFRCYSLDGITSEPDSRERQTEFCRQCPKSLWTETSAGMRVKPECGEKKQLTAFVPGETGAWLLSIPAGSLRKHWDPYVDKIEHLSAQERQLKGSSLTSLVTVVTEASFVLGKQSTLEFKATGYVKTELSQSEIDELLKLFWDPAIHVALLWGTQEREQQYLAAAGRPLEARALSAPSSQIISTDELINATVALPKPSSRRRTVEPQDSLTGPGSGFDFDL